MFRNLKTKNSKKSVFLNRELTGNYSISPGASSAPTKGNEKDRLTRCKICGFICDKERDLLLPKDKSWAGLGVNVGTQRYAQSYQRYYGAKLSGISKNVLKNGGFTLWGQGWNLDPDFWTLTTTNDSVARVETEDATYGMIQITAGEPD